MFLIMDESFDLKLVGVSVFTLCGRSVLNHLHVSVEASSYTRGGGGSKNPPGYCPCFCGV